MNWTHFENALCERFYSHVSSDERKAFVDEYFKNNPVNKLRIVRVSSEKDGVPIRIIELEDGGYILINKYAHPGAYKAIESWTSVDDKYVVVDSRKIYTFNDDSVYNHIRSLLRVFKARCDMHHQFNGYDDPDEVFKTDEFKVQQAPPVLTAKELSGCARYHKHFGCGTCTVTHECLSYHTTFYPNDKV